jgi:hypothetical protein
MHFSLILAISCENDLFGSQKVSGLLFNPNPHGYGI